MKNILVVGSMNMDLVVSSDEIPKIGETVLGKQFSRYCGGKGANQAVAMAKLGASVTFLGKVGQDPYGDELIDSMKLAGVDTSQIERTREATGVAVINVDKEGNNNIVVVPGANWHVDEEYLRRHQSAFKQADIVVFQLEIPLETVKAGLILAKKLGKTTIVNPAPAFEFDDETLKNIDVLIPNEHELSKMTKTPVVDMKTVEDAAKILIEKGVGQIVVTLGSKGAFYLDKDRKKLYQSIKVKVVDTTGAGDSFIGGFTASYVENKNIDKSIMLGQETAAVTIQQFGAQVSFTAIKEKLSNL